VTGERDTPSGHDFTAPQTGLLTEPSIEASPLPSPFRTDETVFLGASVPPLADERHINGLQVEQRVGRLISSLPYVAQVRQAEPGGIEDSQLTDLIVDMIPGFAIPRVFVQVKSSTRGNRTFYHEIARRMKKKGFIGRMGEETHEQKLLWVQQRRLILINGGTKSGERVLDEYIVQKFISQVAGIVRFERLWVEEQLRRYTGELSDIA